MSQGGIHFKMFVDKVTNSLIAEGKKVVAKHTNELHAKVRENISKSPHSDMELMKLDHPFARKRHSSIQPHGHTPLWSVHLKKGRILKGLSKKKLIGKGRIRGVVGWFSPNKITKWVIEAGGTKKMFGRPVLDLTAKQIKLVDRMREDLKKMRPKVKRAR